MAWNFAEQLSRWGPASIAAAESPPNLNTARSYCAWVARTHYENFSVASVLLPRRLLPHFHAVYAYCRWADDLADETAPGANALALLDWWRGELLSLYTGGMVRHPVMAALGVTIREFDLPAEPFLNLLLAFEQDQRVREYETFAGLREYCTKSANPVGHLVLRLFRCYDTPRAVLADEVCTGLQLANFWQDVARDLAIGRVYLPAEDRARFGVTVEDLRRPKADPTLRELIRFEVERTRGCFIRGRGLLPLLPDRLRLTIDLFIRGGETLLNAIEQQDHDVLVRRPEVNRPAKLRLILQALLNRGFV